MHNKILESSSCLSGYCRQWTNGLIGSQYALPYSKILKYFARLLSKPTKSDLVQVLDWGCGDGHFSHFLLEQGLNVHAYSLEEKKEPLLSILQNRFCDTFHFQKSISNHPVALPYADAQFDAIFSVGVLEHVCETSGNEILSLQELRRILKPGGLLFVFHFPNRYSWIEMVNRWCVKLRLLKKYTHNYLYRAEDIQKYAKSTDFQIVEMGLYNLLPRNCFRNVPLWLSNNKKVMTSVQMIERLLSLCFKAFSQNYYFIFKK